MRAEEIMERKGYRGINKPHNPSHTGHITWYSEDPELANEYADGTDGAFVIVDDIPDDVVNKSFQHGFRTEQTEVKAEDFADRVKRGIIDAFKSGWVDKDTALALVDELLDLELPPTFKKVFMWWQDDSTFTDILKKAGYKAIYNNENGVDTYGIIS